jgi:hypothetical protein
VAEEVKDVGGMCFCLALVFGLLVWLKLWPAAAGYGFFILLLELEDIRMTIARK